VDGGGDLRVEGADIDGLIELAKESALADSLAQKSERALAQADFDGAIKQMQDAIALDPTQGDLLVIDDNPRQGGWQPAKLFKDRYEVAPGYQAPDCRAPSCRCCISRRAIG